VARRDLPDLGERGGRRLGIALRANPSRPLDLTPLSFRVELVQLDRLGLRLGERVHADDHAFPRLDLRRVPVGGFLDLALDETLFDRRYGATRLVDPLDQLPRALLQLVG